MISNAKFLEVTNVLVAYGPASPSSAAPLYASMKNADRCAIVLQCLNGSTVTGSAVALSQATAANGTNAKALAFSTVMANVDVATNRDAFTPTAVSSNTFTTNTTNSKTLCYVIDVKATDLDTANGFDYVAVTLANVVNTVITATYFTRDIRYQQATPPTVGT